MCFTRNFTLWTGYTRCRRRMIDTSHARWTTRNSPLPSCSIEIDRILPGKTVSGFLVLTSLHSMLSLQRDGYLSTWYVSCSKNLTSRCQPGSREHVLIALVLVLLANGLYDLFQWSKLSALPVPLSVRHQAPLILADY